jgi:7,8-dihydroneopterin aldolase/epimerase/oxygenase
MMQSIHIEGMRFYAYHGCNADEEKTGGSYIVDVSITADLSRSMQSDSLSDTIDYCAVHAICRDQMATRSKLIEHVCIRIRTALKDAFPGAAQLRVKVTKLSPPINGDVEKVSFELAD